MSLVLTVIMVLSLAGCGKSTELSSVSRDPATDDGTVWFDEEAVALAGSVRKAGMSEAELARADELRAMAIDALDIVNAKRAENGLAALNWSNGLESCAMVEQTNCHDLHLLCDDSLPKPYFIDADPSLAELFRDVTIEGITIAAPGFYAPQGRWVRLEPADIHLNEKIESFDVGYRSSYMASIDAMKGISNAVISSSLVFMAVFIPVSFMSGTSGTFYTQFGLTMAVAVGISAVNALTLSPALCALFLKPYINEDGTEKNNFAARFRKAFNAAFDAMIERYKKGVLFFIKRKWMVWTLLAASVVLLAFLMNTTKTSLVPDEDQGVVFVNVSTAAGSSLKTTNDVMMRIEKRMMDIPQVLHVQRVAGYGLLAGQGNSFGMLILKLKPWDEREGKENDVQAVIGQVYGRTADIKDASIFAISPGMIPGYGMGNALELHMQDKQGGDVGTFFNTTQQYLGALKPTSRDRDGILYF